MTAPTVPCVGHGFDGVPWVPNQPIPLRKNPSRAGTRPTLPQAEHGPRTRQYLLRGANGHKYPAVTPASPRSRYTVGSADASVL